MIFPDEIVLQILSRLPIKSIFKFKSVCILWYNLLSENYFIQLFHQISIKNPTLLMEVSDSSDSNPSLVCVDESVGVSYFDLDFIKDRVKIRASCNGLLCCSSIPDKGVYYLCNPITRRFMVLPRYRERPVTRFYPDGEALLVGLACDLSNSKFNVVLAGYHRSFGHRSDRSFVCLVYDSDNNKWRKFNSSQDESFTHMNINQVVYVSGSLHWLTSSCSFVLVLDFKNGVWGKIALPNELRYGNGNRAYLLDFDGLLSIVQISDSWLTIWVLKDYDMEKWEVVDKVSLRCIRGMVPGIFPISQSGDCMLLATHKQVLVYNRSNKVWKEMYSVRNGCTLPLWFSSHSFRSTLLSFAKKKVQEDGTLLPEFADDEEQNLFELFSLQLESGLEVDQVRHYEVVYLIHEDREGEVESVNTKVEEFIKEKKGRIWRFSDWGLRRLAYKIQKARNAHYILMNFEIAANWINDFKTMLDKDERVIRHLVMKKDKAETENCPPPPLFSSSYAETDDDEDDDFDEDEDEIDGDDNEEGIVYVDDFIENDGQEGKLKTQKVGR